MKERGIIFSGPMVVAILREVDPKSQTRRLLKPQPVLVLRRGRYLWCWPDASGTEATWEEQLEDHEAANAGATLAMAPLQPYAAGDHLWVRESWCNADTMCFPNEVDPARVVGYPADRTAVNHELEPPGEVPARDLASWNWTKLKTRSPRFMPKWASRIWLLALRVRVERLRDISEDDARAEGMPFDETTTARAAFLDGFYKLNRKRVHPQANPWVRVTEFRRIVPT